jgi:hypothetical protein
VALSAEWQSKHRHVRVLAQRASVMRGVNKVTSGGKRHSTRGCSTAGQLGEGVEKQNSLAKRMEMREANTDRRQSKGFRSDQGGTHARLRSPLIQRTGRRRRAGKVARRPRHGAASRKGKG